MAIALTHWWRSLTHKLNSAVKGQVQVRYLLWTMTMRRSECLMKIALEQTDQQQNTVTLWRMLAARVSRVGRAGPLSSPMLAHRILPQLRMVGDHDQRQKDPWQPWQHQHPPPTLTAITPIRLQVQDSKSKSKQKWSCLGLLDWIMLKIENFKCDSCRRHSTW